MYFYKRQGKQCVDFRGDLILTHNEVLIKTRVKSAAPRYAFNARYILNVARLSRWRKLRASWAALRFIWGPDTALTVKTIVGEEL